MRDIIFRGKRTDNGEWVVGYFVNAVYGASKPVIIRDSNYTDDNRVEIDDWEFVKPETIGQYTGLTTNGNKIFEGDIIVVTDAYDNKVTYTVEYKPTAFCVSQLGVNYSTYLGDFNNGKYEIEVIGNIFDNPELLKGE